MAYLFLAAAVLAFVLIILEFFQLEKQTAAEWCSIFSTDCVSKLGSRRHFRNELNRRILGRRRFQILMVSIENFVSINQCYGYKVGDEFINEISKWLIHYYKDSRGYRFSSVTFAVLCPYTTKEQAGQNFEELYKRFNDKWQAGGFQSMLNAFVVELVKTNEEWSAEQIMEFLERMMEVAKRERLGKMRFSPQIEAETLKRKRMLALLKDAIERKSFQVWYQPIFDCARGEFCGAEALVRLQDSEGNIHLPKDFIQLAEETGLMNKVSWIVLEQVCRFLAEHPKLSLEAVSVNFSMHQFQEPELVSRLLENLKQYDVAPERIKIEITEQVIASDTKHVCEVMEYLIKKGIGFYLDDFGTGYSNFSVYMRLPFECIKLDRSLFTIKDQTRDHLVIGTLIKLFHRIGCNVVAEGLETEAQCVTLCRLMSDQIQGYYYARPMPEDRLIAFLTEKVPGS